MATATLSSGQRLIGKAGNYRVLHQLQKDRDIWTATDDYARKVIIKRAPTYLLNNERLVLEIFRGHPSIRQMIDDIEDPPSLVLEYLDDNLLKISSQKRLKGLDLKHIARNTLEALASLHDKGFVHTDVKPDNILVNYGNDLTRFSQIKLSDCGDAYRFDPKTDLFKEGHVISAAIFRSPEALLNLRWGPPTDIWSLGTSLISLTFGYNWHIFKPKDIHIEDDRYPFWVLIEQLRRFWPVPPSYMEIANEEQLGVLTTAIKYINENRQLKSPFFMAEDEELAREDRDFIVKMMKLDPRDRPTAEELLQDKWFRS